MFWPEALKEKKKEKGTSIKKKKKGTCYLRKFSFLVFILWVFCYFKVIERWKLYREHMIVSPVM